MKVRLIALLVVILVILGAALYLRYGGVTHDRIESKLDKFLEIATRPLPDGMQEAR